MKLIDKILANVVLAVILTVCYFSLPLILAAAYTLDWVLSSYTYLAGLVRLSHHSMISRCIHLMVVPVILLAMTAIYWIKSRRIDVASLLSAERLLTPVWTIWKQTTNDTFPPTGQNSSERLFTCVNVIWKCFKHYAATNSNRETNIDQTVQSTDIRRAVQDVIQEESLLPEPEVVEEQPIQEQDVIEIPARIRTREELRLQLCMEDLGVFEAQGLPEGMTMEAAILLVMTRMAAEIGKGVVWYFLSERKGPYGPEHRPEVQQHQILRPHNLFYKLHTSRINIFRPEEPDCAICFSPLVNGEAMTTHDTCRRTFHEACYEQSLRGRRRCPFDREYFIMRRTFEMWPALVNDPIPAAGVAPPQGVDVPVVAQQNAAAPAPPPPPSPLIRQPSPTLSQVDRTQPATAVDGAPQNHRQPASAATQQPQQLLREAAHLANPEANPGGMGNVARAPVNRRLQNNARARDSVRRPWR